MDFGQIDFGEIHFGKKFEKLFDFIGKQAEKERIIFFIDEYPYLETAEFLDGYTNEEKAICYGLTNGVAKYIEQFDTAIPLEETIISQFYSVGGYFTEEQIKTVITSEKKNPAMYNSIIY